MPTAQTSAPETAATPLRLLVASYEVSGFGLATTRHLLPFQCSTWVSLAPPACDCDPTAQTFERDPAATPLSTLSAPEDGLGLETMLQRVPFQCSTSVFSE